MERGATPCCEFNLEVHFASLFLQQFVLGLYFFPLLPIVLSSLSTLISRCLAVTASSPIMDGAVDQRQAAHGCHRLVHDSAELCISCAQGVATVW